MIDTSVVLPSDIVLQNLWIELLFLTFIQNASYLL
jgi:hypothetical protein